MIKKRNFYSWKIDLETRKIIEWKGLSDEKKPGLLVYLKLTF